MNILIIGDCPLAAELIRLCADAGHTPRALTFDGNNFTPFDNLDDLLADTDVALEVVVCDGASKRDVLEVLDSRLSADVPILSASLNASATEAAGWCVHPERVVGFAAIPPFSGAKVVELLPALQSGTAAVEGAQAFWNSIGREPVTIGDSVGGVLPRIVCNLVNEAAYALMEGVATPADIDRAMQLGTNHPRGPLAWADLIGIPTVVAILEALGRDFGAAQYQPAPLLKQYARANRRFYP